MSEGNDNNGFDWRKTAIKSVRESIKAAGREIKRKTGVAVETGKEKVVDLLDASKSVLADYKNKAVEAFANFPNKEGFAIATVLALAATQTTLLSVAALNAPALEPSQRIMFAALNAPFALIPAGGSVAMFREWVNNSNLGKK